MTLIGDSVYVINVPGASDYQGNKRAAGIVVNVSGDGTTSNIQCYIDSQNIPIYFHALTQTASSFLPYYVITRVS